MHDAEASSENAKQSVHPLQTSVTCPPFQEPLKCDAAMAECSITELKAIKRVWTRENGKFRVSAIRGDSVIWWRFADLKIADAFAEAFKR